jgi:threonine/homoserine/homoserine lactone efflux protein
MITLNFLLTSLIVVLIPGTGVIYTISTGLTLGKRASIFAALGCTAGIIPHLAATVLGLSAVMHASALAFQALKYAGVAYLFYLAYATWRDKTAFALDTVPQHATAGSLVIKAHAFRQAVIESPRVQDWLRRSFAAAFAGLAIDLALSDR